MGKKKERAAARCRAARDRKERRFYNFLVRLARRRSDECAYIGMCCFPRDLGMSLEELFSHGQELCGGQGYLLPPGEFQRLIGCRHMTEHAMLLIPKEVRLTYNEDGTAKGEGFVNDY